MKLKYQNDNFKLKIYKHPFPLMLLSGWQCPECDQMNKYSTDDTITCLKCHKTFKREFTLEHHGEIIIENAPAEIIKDAYNKIVDYHNKIGKR